jgi:hypothetical protein
MLKERERLEEKIVATNKRKTTIPSPARKKKAKAITRGQDVSK